MSDTPRTDAALESTWGSINVPTNPIPADFARQLERELAEVTKQRDDLLESLKEVMPYIIGDRCVPWKKAQDAIDRATEGGTQ